MTIIDVEYDPETKLPLLVKNLIENKRFTFEGSGDLDDADTLDSLVNITVTPLEGLEETSSLTLGVTVFSSDGKRAQLMIGGGIAGERYLIAAVFTTLGGETIQLEGVLKIEY